MATALAATLHDATGALAGDVRRHLPVLRRVYAGGIAVATSPTTADRMQRLLAAEGVHAGTPARDTRGPLYRRAIRAALATGAGRVHYLDFDRALHWMEHGPGELRRVVRTAFRWRVVLLGRTVEAHRSHQRPLWETETAMNLAFAAWLGLRGRVDFLAPSFLLDRRAAARLLGASRASGSAIYGEIAALLPRLAPALAYVECAGLDWETPDRARAAVRRVGLARWRRRFEGPEEWALRHRMADEILRGFARARGRRRTVRFVRPRLRAG